MFYDIIGQQPDGWCFGCMCGCSTRRTYKVITSLPNSTISIKNIALVEFSSGAYFFCLKVFYHSANFVRCLPLVHRCLPHRASAPFVEQFPQKERAVAILTFF